MTNKPKIKLFQSLRKYFQILGTYSPELHTNRPFNPRNVFVLICYIQLFVSSLAFSLFEARSVNEYGRNYYGYMTELLFVFIVASQICRMADISKFIENCEEFIARRESNQSIATIERLKIEIKINFNQLGRNARTFYDEVNEKIERWNKMIYFVTAIVSCAGVILPPLLITTVNYCIYDLKQESYLLPFPVV